MAIILGIDRFMSMLRAVINMLGNGVATLVVARWEREFDGPTLRRAFSSAAAGELAPQPELAQRASY
jgi:aerobic C4-dicarboxylate transport protein